MQLDRVLLNSLLGQELEDLGSLIPLELDHSPHVFIFYQCTIARKLLQITVSPPPQKRPCTSNAYLLELFENLLIIKIYSIR
jgi:hypothetical protein